MNERPTNEQVLMQVAQGFLQRADLKGGEVDSYAKCFNFVQTIVEGENVIVPAEAWKEGLDAIQEVKYLHAELDEAYARLGEDRLEKAKPAEPDESNGDSMVSEGGPVHD